MRMGNSPASPIQLVSRFVTVTMGAVIGLTFLFGFGNIWTLALKLGVPEVVAPLVAPAVDLTVLGLLVGMRYLALSGVVEDVLRPARRLLVAASVATLLLNVADPVCSGHWGKAAFDSVGPLLLIGWAEVGPGLLRALGTVDTEIDSVEEGKTSSVAPLIEEAQGAERADRSNVENVDIQPGGMTGFDSELVELARRADAEHWRRCHRPISAETLRKQLHVGASRSRALVTMLRAQSKPVDTANAEPRGSLAPIT